MLAVVVIGGMRSMLGPALGALFFILFRELLSIWTPNWLLWFGLLFVAFVLYSPGGLVGIWATLSRRWWPPPEESAAMSRRKIYEGLPLPDFLRPTASEGAVLQVEAVSKSFGGIRAVREASLQIRSGEIHALIGPNGAGKTTLFNLVSGLYAPDAGTIRLHGRDIHGMPSELICHQGLARSFQITNLFNGLSIYENLRLSLQARAPGRYNIWRDIDEFPGVHAETTALMKFLGLEGIENIEGGELSYGGQRLVDLGIALGSKPQVLLLDEPLAGLAAAERERVSNLVRNVAQNIPVLIVEHDIDRVLGFSHDVTVMNQGEILMTGPPEAVRVDRRVQEVYTGTGTPAVEHSPTLSAGKDAAPVLRFDKINTFYGKEWSDGALSPAGYNPTRLDARQWVKTAQEAGMRYLIFTAKHHDGFCNWPTETTDYSVRSAPWKGGKGDVVRELAEACRDAGMPLGLYLSPWDRNHAEYGRPAYILQSQADEHLYKERGN
jgi:ABC-type branched-subunit amino acid transport system ATPase component